MYDCIAQVINKEHQMKTGHTLQHPITLSVVRDARGKSMKKFCNASNFCCSFVNGAIQLRQKNHFCCKVQGQMALCAAKWYDFLYDWVTATFHDQVKWFFDKKILD